jgi:hypothetical protein
MRALTVPSAHATALGRVLGNDGRSRLSAGGWPASTGRRAGAMIGARCIGGRRCLGQNLSGGPGPRRSVGTTEDCPALPWLAGAMKRFCIWSRAHGSGCDGSPLALPEGELTPAAQLSFAKRSEPPYCIRRVLRKVSGGSSLARRQMLTLFSGLPWAAMALARTAESAPAGSWPPSS